MECSAMVGGGSVVETARYCRSHRVVHPSRARAIARVDASMCISATRTKMRLDNPIASYISEYLYICFLLAPSHPCRD